MELMPLLICSRKTGDVLQPPTILQLIQKDTRMVLLCCRAAVLPCCLTFARTAAPAPSTATVDTAQPAAQIESDSSPLPGSFDANLPKFCHAAVSLSLRSIFTQQRCFPFPPGFGLSASVCQAHRTERQHLQNNSEEIILVYERKHIWPLCSKQFASCVHDLSY